MSGLRGPQGYRGPQGLEGMKGCQGLPGAPGKIGAQGADGAIGVRGPVGQIGNKGAQGDKGDKGNRGNTGAQGLQGSQGKIGCRGDQGYRGPIGPQGAPGFQGYQGLQGIQGFQGDTGFKGPQGDDGSSVIFGTTGPSTGSTHYSGLSKIYFDENTFQIDPIDGSGIIISSGLKVGVTGSTTTSYGNINTLLFNSDAGFDINQNENDTGIAIIGMNSTFKYWQVDGNTGLQAKGLDTVNFVAGNGITILADKNAVPQSLTISSTGTGTGGGGGNSDISGPPNPITFGNISYTSRYIYIPWTYPTQTTIIGDTYLPYIYSFSAYYTINDISHNIIVDGSGSYYIKGPPSTSKQTQTNITGIILTNVSTGTPTPGTFTQVHFPDNISRWCYIHYDPSLSLLSEAGASGTITAYYSNYNTSSGVSNKTSKTFNGFSAPGIPSTSTSASFSYTYPDALLNTKNVDIAVNVINTTPYSNGSTGPWIDKDNKGASTYQIQKYKYIYESNGSTIRYDVPLADASQNVSGDSSLQTIHYLYPDASYMLYEQVNNNSSTDASYSSISDPIPFHSQSLQVRAVCSDLKFPTLTNSCKSAYLVTDTNRQNLKTNVIFTEPSEQVVSSDPVTSPIHTFGTRGNLVPIGTTLLDISCTITKSGSPTPIDSVSISYKGFDTTYNIPTGSSGQGICTIVADAIPVDSYADSSLQYQGFYLETSNNVIRLQKEPSQLFVASNQLNTINLEYIRRNNVIDTTSTDISYSSYSFYYDPYSTDPSINSFSATLRSMSAPTKISGVDIITGAIGLTGTTCVLNIGRYFYVNGAIITYSTGLTETTLGNTTNITNGVLDASCIFTNTGLSVSAPSMYAASASISVNVSSVKNCVGTSVASGTTAVSFNMLFDPFSITLVTNTSKYPTAFPSTNGGAGIRVYSGKSNASGSISFQTRFIPTFPNPIILTPYDNGVVINDATNFPNYSEDLQLCNGLIRTKGTTTQGYANYTANKISISANSTLNYSNINPTDHAGYRYATFAWLCPTTPLTYSKITFTMYGVSGTITGVTTEQPQVDGANIYMFYRLQEGGTGNPGTIAPSGNANTYWINAFGSSTSVSNTNIYANSNPSSLGGDDTSLPSTFSGTTLTMYCVIPSFVVSNASLGNAASRIMYFRVGLPMAKDIGFEYITALFS